MSISGDGRRVAFTTTADLVGWGDSFSDVFVLDRRAAAPDAIRQRTWVQAPSAGVRISSNGEVVAFTSAGAFDSYFPDTNGVNDVYRALADPNYYTVEPERVSFGRDAAGFVTEFSAPSSLLSISGDGLRVTFTTASLNARADLPAELGSPTLGYLAEYGSGDPPQLIAANDQGVIGDYFFGGGGLLTPDGQYALFTSLATNLVSDDSNALFDVFAKHLPPVVLPNRPHRPLDLTNGGTPVTVVFNEVTEAGHTSLRTSASGPAPPPGFSLGQPPTYYDLSTTTLFSGMTLICITYDPTAFSSESNLRLLHHDGSSWLDITLYVHSAGHTVCGDTPSLSPFAIMEGPSSPPAISGIPAHQVIEATSPAGGVASWSIPTAIDGADAAVPVTCAPAAGSPFPLGLTTVTCSATDRYGNQASAHFTVTVRDTTPPALSLPASIIAAATTASGATVAFAASAIDVVNLSVPVQCSPASGSSFAIGATVVRCTASDTAGNIASGSFQVTITSPSADGHVLGTGFIIQNALRHQFSFDVSRGDKRSTGRLELWVADARSCKFADCRERGHKPEGRDDRRDSMHFTATAVTSGTVQRSARGRSGAPSSGSRRHCPLRRSR